MLVLGKKRWWLLLERQVYPYFVALSCGEMMT